ncbi:glycosyltransferase [Kiloniella majae]|uniref:glycosyltransferase n=1 Tax=Kiloniella majae TaxID=1938558 RepID=UPI000A2793D4|nr:glycosyltransferase [Kiloniella majae]
MTTPPRLMFVLPSLIGGGAEKVFVDLANWMVEQGVDVHIVCIQHTGALRENVSSSVHVHTLHVSRLLFAIPALRRVIKATNPDAILSTMTHVNFILLLATRLLGNYSGQLAIQEVALFSRSRGMKDRVLSFFLKFIYSRADRVIAVSDGIAIELSKLLPNRQSIDVIANPINLKKIKILSQHGGSHPWLLDNSLKVVLAVGRLSNEKDFPTLIRAFAKVHNANENTRLIILGDGTLRNSLQELIHELSISDCVEMPGFVENPYVMMAQADLFVLSSVAEGFALVLAEALACGCPVVTTDCGAEPKKMIEQGRFGHITPVGNDDAMAIIILKSLETVSHKNNMPEHIRTYDIDVIAHQYLGVLQISELFKREPFD